MSALKNIFHNHSQSLFHGLKHVWQRPFISIVTIVVIAVALAIPTGLLLLLQNIQMASHGFDNGTTISLFLKMDTSISQEQALLSQLQQSQDIASVKYISPQQGLQELEQQSGLGNVLTELNSNPLPAVIEVKPSRRINSAVAINSLLQRLQTMANVDNAELDMMWVKRLFLI